VQKPSHWSKNSRLPLVAAQLAASLLRNIVQPLDNHEEAAVVSVVTREASAVSVASAHVPTRLPSKPSRAEL